MRFRHFYSCGHSSSITDREAVIGSKVQCWKCLGDAVVTRNKQLKDTAKMPSETRKFIDAEAYRAARRAKVPNHAARHWQVP